MTGAQVLMEYFIVSIIWMFARGLKDDLVRMEEITKGVGEVVDKGLLFVYGIGLLWIAYRYFS